MRTLLILQRRNAMTQHKLDEPRLDTPTPSTGARTSSFGLPDTLVSEQIHRLAVCAAIGGGLWCHGVVMDTIVRPLTLSQAVPVSSVVIEFVSIAVSIAMFAYVRYSSHSYERKSNAGLMFFVLNAAAVALLNAWLGL